MLLPAFFQIAEQNAGILVSHRQQSLAVRRLRRRVYAAVVTPVGDDLLTPLDVPDRQGAVLAACGQELLIRGERQTVDALALPLLLLLHLHLYLHSHDSHRR